ncbi:MAG: hypothetical protein J6Y12_09600, partial [Lachnospiraceae bacterium]|nr:hypothetical protein [Lachnospiraceae bacterium]
EPEEHEESDPIDWKYPALIAAASLAAALLLLIIIKLAARIRYSLSDDEKKYNILFARNMKLLRMTGLSKPDEETFEEFGKRAEKEIPRKLLSFIDTYETYAYRGDKITGKEVTVVYDNNKGIIDHIRKTGLRGRISLIGYYLFMT